jgi:glutaredoxin 2
MLELNKSQTEASETLIIDEQDIKHQKEHIEDCIQSAKTVFSNASSYNGSILGDSADVADMTGNFGSVLGLNDDQRQRVRKWIPGKALNDGMFFELQHTVLIAYPPY